jgi:hypothetical protein
MALMLWLNWQHDDEEEEALYMHVSSSEQKQEDGHTSKLHSPWSSYMLLD